MTGQDEPVETQAAPSKEDQAKMMPKGKTIKIIILGDSAVGKSKMVERFLLDEYNSQRLSTYGVQLYETKYTHEGETYPIDIWDTAGQEIFNKMHPSYYYQAHACILVFDCTRKVTYKNLDRWYSELQNFCENVPTLVVANKIDMDYKVTSKQYNFATSRKLPFFFVSASDGTNVVKIFRAAIVSGIQKKQNPSGDILTEVLNLLEEQ